MMKRKNLLFRGLLAVAAVPMLMASCNSDEPRPEINQYVTIGRVGVGEMETRAGYDATNNFLPDSGIMKLILNSSNSDAKYSTSGLDYTPSSDGWSTPKQLLWAVNSSADWSVFFTSRPTNEYSYDTDSRELTWSVPADQSKLTDKQFEGIDLLYDGGKTSSASISPTLKHAMAKIVVNYFCEVDVNETQVPDSAIIDNISLSRKIDVEIGENWQILPYENTTAKDNIKLRPVGTPTATKATFEGIVIPQVEREYPSYIKVYYHSGKYAYSVSAGIDKIEPGKIYTINIYRKGRYATAVNDVTITPWEEVKNAGSLETDEEL